MTTLSLAPARVLPIVIQAPGGLHWHAVTADGVTPCGLDARNTLSRADLEPTCPLCRDDRLSPAARAYALRLVGALEIAPGVPGNPVTAAHLRQLATAAARELEREVEAEGLSAAEALELAGAVELTDPELLAPLVERLRQWARRRRC